MLSDFQWTLVLIAVLAIGACTWIEYLERRDK